MRLNTKNDPNDAKNDTILTKLTQNDLKFTKIASKFKNDTKINKWLSKMTQILYFHDTLD